MSHWLLWCRKTARLAGLKPGHPAGRIVLLFLGAVLLIWPLATSETSAHRLFQSPESPFVEAVPPPESPPDQPALEVASPEVSSPGDAAPEAPPIRRERDEEIPPLEDEEGGSRNFILDRAEFIDSIIVSGAYVWVCCGIGLLLLAPLFLLVVEIRGRSKRRRRDK